MKILQVGSSSIHFTNYLNAIKSNSDEICVISEDGFTGIDRFEHRVIEFRTMNPFKLFKAALELKKAIKALEPTIIHIHQVNRLAFFVARVASHLGIPIVTTAWGSDVLIMPKKNALYKLLVRKTLNRSSIVTADSEEMIRAMKQLCPSIEYVHVQYGIELIESVSKEKIIYSNRLHKPLYRIEAIIKYFHQFIQLNREWKLAIGATGKETDELKALVSELELNENIIFLGWLDSKTNNEWYAKSKFYISIPESDGTAVSLLEAMSAGCIPIVSDLEVSKEWIIDGENGVIEKNGKNPLIEALKIDQSAAAAQNKKMIEKRASRSASQMIFQKIYSDVSKN